MKQAWTWLLINNPSGLASMLTVWAVGALYLSACFVGLIEGDPRFVFRYCLWGGPLVFILVPLAERASRSPVLATLLIIGLFSIPIIYRLFAT